MRAVSIHALGVALALLSPACSLLGLQNFEVPPCTGDSDCAALNDLDPDTTECLLYQCTSSGSCELQERDDDDDGEPSVACGGADCDDADPFARLGAEVVTTPIVTGVASPRWLRWGGSPANELGVTYAFTSAGQAGFDVLSSGSAAAPATQCSFATDAIAAGQSVNYMSVRIAAGCPRVAADAPPPPTDDVVPPPPADKCQTHLECQDGIFCNGYETCDWDSPLADPVTGCRASARETPCSAGSACDEGAELCFTTVASSGTCPIDSAVTANARGSEWITAAVTTDGCASGGLYVGWMSTTEVDLEQGEPGPNVLVRQGFSRNPGFGRVGLGGAGSCTGGHRAEGEPIGVAGLAVAALSADPPASRYRPQGLIAYLAAPACRGRSACTAPGATGPVSVEVLGAWLEQSQKPAASEPARWVSLSDSGTPRVLDVRTNGDAAPALLAIAGGDAGYLIAYGAEAGGLVARFIPALADPMEVSTGIAPFYPTLTDALAPPSSSTLRVTPKLDQLGMDRALPGGGGATAQVDHVVVAQAPAQGGGVPLMFTWLEGEDAWAMSATLDPGTGAVDAGTPARVSTGGATQPSVAYISANLCGPDCGGFAVTWVEGGTARLHRFTEDGAPVDAAAFDLGVAAAFPRAFESNGALRVALHDPDAMALAITNAQCPPAP